MEYLYGKDMTELRRLCEELSLPRFAAGQIARWLYRRHTTDAAAMTDLPAALEFGSFVGYNIAV